MAKKQWLSLMLKPTSFYQCIPIASIFKEWEWIESSRINKIGEVSLGKSTC